MDAEVAIDVAAENACDSSDLGVVLMIDDYFLMCEVLVDGCDFLLILQLYDHLMFPPQHYFPVCHITTCEYCPAF